MKTLNQLKNQFGEILSREELKNVIGGVAPGTRCVIYCCTNEGNCSDGQEMPLGEGGTCSSNEECQALAIENEVASCPDENAYVAALCKG